jgi:hypothetical protein
MMSDYKAIPKEARKSEKEMHNFCWIGSSFLTYFLCFIIM